MKQYLSDMISSRKRNVRDNFEGLHYTSQVYRFIYRMEEQLEQKWLQISKAKEVLFRNIPGSDKKEMSWWRTAAQKELSFPPSICNENVFTGAVDDPLSQSPAARPQMLYGFLLRASGHCAPGLFRTFSQQVGRNTRGSTERRYHLSYSKGRC